MRTLLVGLVLVTLLAACSGSSQGVTSSLPTSFTPSALATPTPCTVAAKPAFAWPAHVPRDLPRPPGSVKLSSKVTRDGITIVTLKSPDSLRQSVLFIVRAIQDAGYELGRGDAEPGEADAPFGSGDLRGLYKMLAVGDCSTTWLVAVTHADVTDGSPLIPRMTTASPSPLPFG